MADEVGIQDDLEGDLELQEDDTEGVKGGGGSVVGQKQASSIYSKSVKDGNVEFQGGTQTVDRTASTQPLGGTSGASG